MGVLRPLVATLLVIFIVSPAAPQTASGSDLSDLVRRAATALEERRFADAFDAFASASRLDDRDPSLPAGAGTAAAMMGRSAEAQQWLARALLLAPNYTAVSILLGKLQYDAGQVQEAITTYEVALRFAPGDPTLEQRLGEWRLDAQQHGKFLKLRDAHFIVQSEGATDDALAQRVLAILEGEYWRICERLRIYPTQPITVVLYADRTFQDVTKAPEWVAGVYDGRIRLPVRGALDHPDALQRILAHELVHALVASIGGFGVPAWLNEGLATMLEPGDDGGRVAYLARTATRLPLWQLQRGFRGLSAEEVLLAYAESADAVDRLLRLRGAPMIVALLQDLARGIPFTSAFHQRMQMSLDEFETTILRR